MGCYKLTVSKKTNRVEPRRPPMMVMSSLEIRLVLNTCMEAMSMSAKADEMTRELTVDKAENRPDNNSSTSYRQGIHPLFSDLPIAVCSVRF